MLQDGPACRVLTRRLGLWYCFGSHYLLARDWKARHRVFHAIDALSPGLKVRGTIHRPLRVTLTFFHRRLTALELITLKIPSVMLCDSMVGSLFQHKGISGIGMSSDLTAIPFPLRRCYCSRGRRQNCKERRHRKQSERKLSSFADSAVADHRTCIGWHVQRCCVGCASQHSLHRCRAHQHGRS